MAYTQTEIIVKLKTITFPIFLYRMTGRVFFFILSWTPGMVKRTFRVHFTCVKISELTIKE